MEESKREAYLAGIYSNCQRARVRAGQRELPLAEMPDADLQTVVIALTHTVMHKLGAKHDHPRTGAGTRAAYGHRVGAKAGQPATPAPRAPEPDDAEFRTTEPVEF